MSSELASVLTRGALREIATGRSFERGEDYFDSGVVQALAEPEGTLAATVYGTREYRVKLWVEDNRLSYDCTCPFAAEGACCKHCVAAGLAWLAEAAGGKQPGKARTPPVTMEDVEAYLARQEKQPLVSLIVEQAMEDARLCERLLMKAARSGAKGIHLATFRQAINRAIIVRGFVDYHEAGGYAQGVHQVISSLEDLLKEGHAVEVIELAEQALKQVEEAIGSVDDSDSALSPAQSHLTRVEEAIGSVDDSDGHLGEVLEQLQMLHHGACKRARPDAEELAQRLFTWELQTE
jgi:uncharacterized Zn finger protein